MTHITRTLSVALLAAALAASPAPARTQTALGPIPMDRELPARSAIPTLFDQLDFQQATQSYLWALPLVAFAQRQAEHRDKFGADSGDLVLYKSYEGKLGILTANATTPYKTLTGRSTCSSGPSHQKVRSETGYRPFPASTGSRTRASTVRLRRISTRAGSSATSTR